MAQPKLSQAKSPFHPDRITVIILAVCLALGITGAILAFNFVRSVAASWTMTVLPGVQVDDGSATSAQAGSGTPSAVEPLQSASGPTPQPWDGTSRVTILLMGLDYRDWQAGDIPRTDSMWLITVDPVSKTAGLMSIPRDTWVQIPDHGMGKINTAYFLGEGEKLPGGGPGLAIKTVEAFLGVPINYYAQIDFQAFVDFIDKLDGIWIDVPSEISVDPTGPGNTITLQAGRQRVFGATALAYARDRHTDGGDFDRSKRQLQVIMAIRDRILAPDYMPKFIAHIGDVYKVISGGVHTNLTLEQAVQFAWLAQQVKPANIHHAMIGPNELVNATSPDNLSIEIPLPDKIRLIRDEIFTTGGPVAPSLNPNADQATLAKGENAKIQIQNGTATAGIAERTSDYLKSLGLNVTGTSNADAATSATTIIDYSGKPLTVGYLVNQMHVSANRVVDKYDPNAQVDVVVVVGQDWAAKNPMP
jgi:polyisoprenyl-teichoic acid--peptidoglycan teichoic acid transferase